MKLLHQVFISILPCIFCFAVGIFLMFFINLFSFNFILKVVLKISSLFWILQIVNLLPFTTDGKILLDILRKKY
jgi:uncharacterized membrane protein